MMRMIWIAGLALLAHASVAAAQTPTVPQMGIFKSSNPYNLCVFDSIGVCQKFLNVPATGGGAYVPTANGGLGGTFGAANGVPLFASGAVTMTGTIGSGTFVRAAAANSSVLVTNTSGVPSFSTTLPNIALGTPTSVTLTNATGLSLTTGVTGNLHECQSKFLCQGNWAGNREWRRDHHRHLDG